MRRLVSRRRFLKSGASAAAFASAGIPWPARSLAARPSLPTSYLDQLRSAIEGRVVVPAGSTYGIESQPWNARFANVLPVAVVIVANANDVRQTIKVAREYGLSFAMRNGRHSFAGFSANTGLIVDVSRLTDVQTDVGREQATFGAGLTNLPLYAKLWPTRMTVPAGTCPTVGLTGLSAAGGIGRLSRLYGLTCDNILEVKIVTAAGEVLLANQRENADLFWACKGGGGGNFGAVVELTARLHPVDMLFTETAFTFPIAGAVRVMTAMQEWVAELPDRGHCWTEIRTGPPKAGAVVGMEFTFAGPESQARALGEKLIRASGVKPIAHSIMTDRYLSRMRDWVCAGLRPDECAYTGISSQGALPRSAFYAKSDLMRRTWPREAFEALVDGIVRRQTDPVLTPPDFQTPLNVGKVAFDTAGGAIARLPATTAAFAHRDIRYIVQYQSRWRPFSSDSVADANIAWTKAVYESVRPWLSGSAYQGYADPYLSDW